MAFVAELECQPGELVKLRAELGAWLIAHHVPAQTAFHVKLVAHEAAKNAIDHSDPCDHVAVTADFADDEIVIQVADATWSRGRSLRRPRINSAD